MKNNQVVRKGVNRAILIFIGLMIFSLFFPWIWSVTLVESGQTSSFPADEIVDFIPFFAWWWGWGKLKEWLILNLLVLLVHFFLLKKKINTPKIVSVLMPVIPFVAGWWYLNVLYDIDTSYAVYNAGFGWYMFMISSFLVLCLSPFRLRKAKEGELPGISVIASSAVKPSDKNDTSNSLEESLARLKKMKEDGLITEDEFQVKKSELLNRL